MDGLLIAENIKYRNSVNVIVLTRWCEKKPVFYNTHKVVFHCNGAIFNIVVLQSSDGSYVWQIRDFGAAVQSGKNRSSKEENLHKHLKKIVLFEEPQLFASQQYELFTLSYFHDIPAISLFALLYMEGLQLYVELLSLPFCSKWLQSHANVVRLN